MKENIYKTNMKKQKHNYWKTTPRPRVIWHIEGNNIGVDGSNCGSFISGNYRFKRKALEALRDYHCLAHRYRNVRLIRTEY